MQFMKITTALAELLLRVQAFRLLQNTRTAYHSKLVSLILRIHIDINPALIENVVMESFCHRGSCMRSSVYAFSALWDASCEYIMQQTDGWLLTAIIFVSASSPSAVR
jgi:hypothetical protein